MRRPRQRLSFVKHTPARSILHTTAPDRPLPIEGCYCDDCDDARVDTHLDTVGALLGLDAQAEHEPQP